MENIIQQFIEKEIEKLYKCRFDLYKSPGEFMTFIKGIREVTNRLEIGFIRETLEEADMKFRECKERKDGFDIIKRDARTVTTSLGAVTYKRTYFQNRETGEYSYPVDALLNIDRKERLTEDAVVRVLEEVTEASYRKTGEETCMNQDTVSKQTVLNVMHSLEFPAEKEPETKKAVETLYIDADEDHVALQFLNHKGDVKRTGEKYKNNCMINKLVYVYEGIEKESPKGGRNRLINAHFFSGEYAGEKNAELWNEVAKYIESHYDTQKLKKVYLNADGGSWISAGKDRIQNIVPVLDEFHMSKYIIGMTHFLGDSADDAATALREAITSADKGTFNAVAARIREHAEDENTRKRIAMGSQYILRNWDAAVMRLTSRGIVRGCSAEGHVSHVLASRMSTRPMGWSRKGADRMAHLLAYRRNGGNLLELVRYQDREEELPVAAGAEEVKILSCSQVLASERNKHGDNGSYIEKLQATLSLQSRKQAAIALSLYI